MAHVTIKRPDGQDLPLYIGESTPTSKQNNKTKAGVIVLQEWWGLNQQIKAHTDALTQAGFIAVSPDLYRGACVEEVAEANHLMTHLNFPSAIGDIAAAAKYMSAELGCDKVGVWGLCMGGALTIASLVSNPRNSLAAGVCFYGIPDFKFFDPASIRVPLQCHFGNQDKAMGFADKDTVNQLESQLKKGKVSYELHRYEAGHAFMNDKSDHLLAKIGSSPNKEARILAMQRSIQFLKQHLLQ